MDDKTRIQELKNLVQTWCEERDWDQFHNPKELAVALSIEAAELLEHFRFKSEEQMKDIMKSPEHRKKVSNEVADVLFHVLRFAQKNNIDLSTAFKEKLDISTKKYPVEKCKGKNKKYDEY